MLGFSPEVNRQLTASDGRGCPRGDACEFAASRRWWRGAGASGTDACRCGSVCRYLRRAVTNVSTMSPHTCSP